VSSYDDIDLMLYADGEVDAETGEAIGRFLDRDDDARCKVEALEQIADTIRSHLELAADDAEPRLEAMWDVLERRISANGAGDEVADAADAAVADAAEIDDDPAPVGRRPARRARRGVWAAISQWFEGYRGYVLTGALAAGAAALVVMALRPPEKTVIVQQPVVVKDPVTAPVARPVTTPDGPAAPSDPAVTHVADESSPPEFEHLELNGSGTIFLLPREGKDDVSATVIFIDMNDVEGPL